MPLDSEASPSEKEESRQPLSSRRLTFGYVGFTVLTVSSTEAFTFGWPCQ